MARGERPERPANGLELGLNDDIWELAQNCWDQDPNKRPNVTSVLERLKQMLETRQSVSPMEPPTDGVVVLNSTPSFISKRLKFQALACV